ncbi:bacillithiol biosynthesis cysteine-adding enzyme BshC [Chungangia koreensis]|uniref:Putative cysteine ligase BshC n=1 Tax=Chungangia koreensis TaxID=752657 RepID=A0ABV8X5H8_9LACT
MKSETSKMPNMSRLLSDYLTGAGQANEFFHHDVHGASIDKRLKYLQSHPVRREELTAVIESYMEPLGISKKARKHLDELKENAVVVIGGQQAGLLTGPLYSVHKVISIVIMAKKYRAMTGVPVIPIFWIAGEDHDLDEINHTYTISSGKLRKHAVPIPYMQKSMAAETALDQNEVMDFVDEVFRQFGETIHTESLLAEVKEVLSVSTTFTDFFARLMNSLFQNEGLLLIDAAYGPLRTYESSFFEKLIDRSEEIAEAVFAKEAIMEQAGYGQPVGVSQDAAHLFYLQNGERALLKRVDGDFVNETLGLHFTKSELMSIAKTSPQLLSNNVVTRPIMQDLVFPVLTFVGGQGEIAYWGLLKEAFEVMGIEMPIVAPRFSITLVDRQVEQLLKEEKMSVEDVFQGSVSVKREEFLTSVSDSQTETLLNETQQLILEKYEQIKDAAKVNGLLTQQLIDKNVSFHLSQLAYLKGKLEESTLIRHDVQLRRYETLMNHLLPEGGLQERKYNPYMYLNQYGPDLINDLLKLDYRCDGSHHIVYL